jgi:Replication initiation factor
MTPPTNSGVNFPDDAAIGLGWLSLTLYSWTANERGRVVHGLLDALGESEPRTRERGPKHYDQGVDVLGASAIGWTDERPTEVHLTLKQRDCSWQRFAAILQLADACERWKATRVDLNYDDAARVVEPAELVSACRDGNAVTRVDLDRVQAVMVGGVVQSVYVGQRSSERYLCVYDKDAERAAAERKPVAVGTHGVRWELRQHDERATQMVKRVRALRDAHALREAFWSAVVSLVDFRQRDRSGRVGHHYEKWPRLEWFSRLAGQLARQASYLARTPEREDVRLWRLDKWLVHCAAAVAEWQEKHENPTAMRDLLDFGATKLADRRARTRAVISAA